MPDPVAIARARQLLLDRQRALLRKGRIAYSVPREMQVDELSPVRVEVAGAESIPGFPAANTPGLTVKPVMVGTDLTAELDGGDDFQITRVDGDDGRRTLASDDSAEWQWLVRPTRSGSRTLYLTLIVRTAEDGPATEVRTLQEPVDVRVNVGSTVASWVRNYLPATGLTVPVLITALGGLGVVLRRRAMARRRASARHRNAVRRRDEKRASAAPAMDAAPSGADDRSD